MNSSRHYFHLKGKDAESFVQELALRTFLTDWCYPNPKLPRGKELCDLLVVYDQTAIIWQIKDLKLDRSGHYKKSQVAKNLRQLAGARRSLFQIGIPIELENPRRTKESFDSAQITNVYLISVLLGEEEPLFPLVQVVNDHTMHVFDREFTQIILTELDTIADFTEYLKAKEKMIQSIEELKIVGGEEELLAFYLLNNRSFNSFGDANHVIIDQGSWEKHFEEDPQYKAKKKEDEISYAWDGIINRAHEGGHEYECIARELARPNRFHRRVLAREFYEAHVTAHEDNIANAFRRLTHSDNITYCFLFCDEKESHQTRKAMLHAFCFVARGKVRENQKVLGIATEKHFARSCSYDFCLLDYPEWTEQCQSEMERLQTQFGILTAPTITEVHEREYPV